MDRGFCTSFSCGNLPRAALQDNTKQKRKLVHEHRHPHSAAVLAGATGALPTSMHGGAGLGDFHPQGMYFAHWDITGVWVYLQMGKIWSWVTINLQYEWAGSCYALPSQRTKLCQ